MIMLLLHVENSLSMIDIVSSYRFSTLLLWDNIISNNDLPKSDHARMHTRSVHVYVIGSEKWGNFALFPNFHF